MIVGAGGFCKAFIFAFIFVLARWRLVDQGGSAGRQDRATLESDLSGCRARRLSPPMLPLGSFFLTGAGFHEMVAPATPLNGDPKR